jgi:hypothetical protein
MDEPAKPFLLHAAGAARENRAALDGPRFIGRKEGSSVGRARTPIEVAFTFSSL